MQRTGHLSTDRFGAWPRKARPAVSLIAAVVAALAAVAPAEAITVGDAERIGRWGAPFVEGECGTGGGTGCPAVPQTIASLPDGRIFYFEGRDGDADATGGDATRSLRLLDVRGVTPRWAGPALAGRAGPGIHCGDIAQMADGRLLVAGGGTWTMDPATSSVADAAPMRQDRWHASLVTLADGSLLLAGGSGRVGGAGRIETTSRTETFHPRRNVWTENYVGPASENSLPPLPQLFLMPNGKVFYGGAGQSPGPGGDGSQALWGLQQFFDPRTSRWELAGPSPWGPRHGATSVMLPLDPPYDRATILTYGGSTAAGSSAATLSTLATVDGSGKVVNQVTGEMQRARAFSVAVPLPDGSVLALGGSGLAGAGPAAGEEPDAEVFVPGAPSGNGVGSRFGAWFKVATPNRHRTYHHSAVLLPDGRVLLGGHSPEGPGLAGAGAPPADASFEMFTPHYLFRGAARPVIRRAPDAVTWGERFTVESRQALGIGSVVLMRLGSSQHGTDNDTRTIRLPFSRASGHLDVTAPPDGTVAPPGYYYLFLNQDTPKGAVPSVAKIVRIGGPGT